MNALIYFQLFFQKLININQYYVKTFHFYDLKDFAKKFSRSILKNKQYRLSSNITKIMIHKTIFIFFIKKT